MLASATQLACRAAREEVARRGGSLAAGETVDVKRTYRHVVANSADQGTRRPEGVRSHAALALCAMKVAADVDVELETIRVARIGAAADVGHADYPAGVDGQVEGGAAQGLGLALMEEPRAWMVGASRTRACASNLIPTACDVPPIETVLVEEAHPDWSVLEQRASANRPRVVAPAAVASAVRRRAAASSRGLPIRAEAVAGVVADPPCAATRRGRAADARVVKEARHPFPGRVAAEIQYVAAIGQTRARAARSASPSGSPRPFR